MNPHRKIGGQRNPRNLGASLHFSLQEPAEQESDMNKELDDKLDPKAKGAKTLETDFDRNRDGLYGGLPKARDRKAPGPEPKEPHPPR